MGKCKLLSRSIPRRVFQSPSTLGTNQKVMYPHLTIPELGLNVVGYQRHADEYVHRTCVLESCHAWVKICLSNCPPAPYDLAQPWRKQSHCSARNVQENDGQHRQVYQRRSSVQGTLAHCIFFLQRLTKIEVVYCFPSNCISCQSFKPRSL
jgi:hypothetical protein